ncbi:hypothetical protein DNTS_034466 [Danionella cerebrum]|uniref:Transcriptional protein SWT1 n=1 Tax=Danionella cerebrum TaxID=2873325 RepID=A0A553RJR8_9TELE|nr:hypothetical protein DNTS_034466 [Danionella translucida]
MSQRKSKKKKHKEDEKFSGCSREDKEHERSSSVKGKEETKRNFKHVEKDQKNRKSPSPHTSGKGSTKHPTTEQHSSKEKKEHVSKWVSEEDSRTPRKNDSQENNLKRRLSPELHAEPKPKDIKSTISVTHTDSEVPKKMTKMLEVSSKMVPQTDKTGINSAKKSWETFRRLHVGSKLKIPKTISYKKEDSVAVKDSVELKNTADVISGHKNTSFHGSSSISFKIPKKGTVARVQTNREIFDAFSPDSPTQSTTQPSLTPTPAKPALFIPKLLKPKALEVSTQNPQETASLASLLPSIVSPQVQQVNTDHKEEVTVSEKEPVEEHMQLVEELHLARSENRLDMSLVDNCGELTCMDIDPPEEGPSFTLNQQREALLIVLDTNVLLSHLDYVKKIRSHGLSALGFPTLLIPWVVLQELDHLKGGKLSTSVADKARPAVNFIYSCLKNQEPRLKGQSMQQASQAVCGLTGLNNDDRVLQCCLQYQTLLPESDLLLCTNDKNLCSKALLSGVKAFSKADLVKEVEKTTTTLLNYCPSNPAVPPPVGSVGKVENEQRNRQNHEEQQKLSECVSLLESCLQRVLSVVLEEEMKEVYGDLWTEIVYVKPPWTLEGVLKCFKKHWIAVFGMIIKRSLLSCVEMLSDWLCSGQSVDPTSVLHSMRLATELLSALADRSQYSSDVAQALSTLHELEDRLQPPKKKDDADNEDSLMAEVEEDAVPSHQEVWTVFESIWNNVCQISSALFSALHFTPGTTEPNLSSTSPPPQEALSCLQRLSAALKQLLEGLQREKLCIGGRQLSELYANLDQCVSAVNPWP